MAANFDLPPPAQRKNLPFKNIVFFAQNGVKQKLLAFRFSRTMQQAQQQADPTLEETPEPSPVPDCQSAHQRPEDSARGRLPKLPVD